MEEDTTLYQQLRKLADITSSDEALDHILSTLWKTRRTGLRPPDKSHIQSLLNLPSPAELDPVLACLRSLIRKCVHHNFTGDDLLKLFPPDLPLDLQTLLVLSFHKYQNHWKDDLSREQHSSPRTSEPYQVPSFPSSSDISTPLWPRQDDPVARLNRGANDLGAFAPNVAGSGLQPEALLPNNPGTLPRLKSMTWTMENRVAVINLKPPTPEHAADPRRSTPHAADPRRSTPLAADPRRSTPHAVDPRRSTDPELAFLLQWTPEHAARRRYTPEHAARSRSTPEHAARRRFTFCGVRCD
ncbi:hypothetical protein SLA2020_335830 [Shorea laevis]